MNDDKFLEAVTEAYKAFDESYEALEVQPYNAAFDYFKYGALFMKQHADIEHESYLRALADSENIKKNFAKKQADLYEYRYEPIMRELLDVLDDFDRGVTNNAFTEGGKLIFHKLSNILAKNGLEKIFPIHGEDFNSDTMEAVATLPQGEEKTGKVIDCTLCGYTYNGKIIRYPKVVVGA